MTELSENQSHLANPQLSQNIPHNELSQRKQDTLLEAISQKDALVDVLRKQVQKLQNQSIISEIQNREIEKKYHETLEQIEMLKQKIETLKENNESIIHTFQVFQRQFVKRDYKNGINITLQGQKEKTNNSDGPLFLELIRNMKSKFSEPSTQQNKSDDISQLNQYYGYFFNENTDDSEEELYREVSEQKESSKSLLYRIKTYGRKKYFKQKYRNYFWYNIIDRPLKITYKLYERYLQQCDCNRQNQLQDKNSLIDRDLNRMDFKLDDQKGKLMRAAIKTCLQVFQIYRPDIGYVQGMSYLAWMLLIRMDDYQAFSCFANLIVCDPFIYSLYLFKEHSIRKIKTFYEKCMEERRSKIYKHMRNLEVDSELFIIQWAYTMFTRAFNLRISSKIWDLWFCQGYGVFFKVVLVIMDMLESEILQMNQNDKIIELLRTQTHKLDQSQFLRNLRKQKLSEELEL